VVSKPQNVMQKPHLTGAPVRDYTARHAHDAATLCFC
jgi:hypothetical protein